MVEKVVNIEITSTQLGKEKIGFLVGIICGGIKSSFFTEYLAGKTGSSNNDYKKAEYRIKDFNSSASCGVRGFP